MQITNIEFSLGNKKETIKDLGKLNPDWVIDKILEKTSSFCFSLHLYIYFNS